MAEVDSDASSANAEGGATETAPYDTQLDSALQWEKRTPNRRWLTQPQGGGQVREYTWSEALDEARRIAAHLVSLDLPRGSHIALFSKNCAHWILADVAIWMAGHVSVPLYPTLTPDTIRQIIEHSESRLIFVGKLDGYDGMKGGIPDDMPGITLPLCPDGTGYAAWNDLLAANEPLSEVPRRDPDELATIIYTSGSTGTPKGVMHSFRTMTTAARGLIGELETTSSDRMLSYLPLAHAFERWIVETLTLVVGFEVFFAESLETFVHDLKRARPTLFVSVPRLWQKFQLGVFQKMPPGRLAVLLKIPLVNNLIRKRVLEGLGLDQVRFAGSGSAPIPAELIAWYRELGLELLEGYGMTENFSYSHVTRPGQVRPGYVGSPYPSVDCRISKEGEIQVRSPGTMLGYYKMEEKTAGMLTEDGYLKTGDRGEIDDLGRLRITGRVKELFKTSKGKYVAPAPIENRLLLHDKLELACVGGLGHPQPYGIVVLSDQARETLDAKRGVLGESLAAHLTRTNAELDHHEHLQFLAVVSDPWTIENGMLTPTMKLKRAAIEDRYGDRVAGWYDESSPIVWV